MSDKDAPGMPAATPASPSAAPDPNPLDVLFVAPADNINAPQEAPAVAMPQEAPSEATPELLATEVDRIVKAIERLARRGLNLKAVIALLHDANPAIPKKSIKAVLESLRELPAVYGADRRPRAGGP